MKTLATAFLISIPFLGTHAQSLSVSPIFGDQGTREYPVWSGNAAGYDGVLRDDGYLLVAGTGYWGDCNCFHLTLAMLDTTCGALDPAFGNGGVKDVVFEGRSLFHDMFIQDDGKIVACGISSPSNAFSAHKPTVYRLNANGTPDTTFNGTGYHKALWDPLSSGALWQAFPMANGGVACVGASVSNINGGTHALGAMRFLADGSLDPSFSGNGVTTTSLSIPGLTVNYSVGTGVMLADSSLLAIGVVSSGGQETIGLAKFLPDGTADMTFGTSGLAVSSVPLAPDVGTAGMNAVVDAGGGILVSATRDYGNGEFLIARFLPDGSLDPNYGTNGESVVAIAPNALGRRMELLPDGSTLQYGSQNGNNGHARVVKRLSDGSLDMSFGTNGVAAPNTPIYHNLYGGMTLPSGRIIAWGLGGQISIFKFTPDPAGDEFLDIGPDVTGCTGDSVLLDAGSIYMSYLWNTMDSTQTTWVSTAGNYSVTVIDVDECHDADTVNVTFAAPPPQPMVTSTNGVDLNTTATGDLQWYLDGVLIPGATSADWTAVQNGNYTVEVTDANGCSTISAVFTVTTVGVEELVLEHMNVHPNPSDGSFQVDLPGGLGDPGWYLMDAAGRTCEATMDAQGYVDARHLKAGSYTLLIRTRQGQQVTRRIVIR